jgi:hypothetical protein
MTWLGKNRHSRIHHTALLLPRHSSSFQPHNALRAPVDTFVLVLPSFGLQTGLSFFTSNLKAREGTQRHLQENKQQPKASSLFCDVWLLRRALTLTFSDRAAHPRQVDR